MEVRTVLQHFTRLSEVMSTAAAVDKDLAKIPKEVASIEASLHDSTTALATAKTDLDASNKEIRKSESGIADIRAKISRHQEQLMAVKTNVAYKALNQEIAGEKKGIENHEDSILVLMERADELTSVIGLKEVALGEEKTRVAEEKAELEQRRKALEEERQALSDEAIKIRDILPPASMERYDRIAETRSPVMSLVDGETCRECGVSNRPQALAEARQFDRIVTCEICSRILYYATTFVSETTTSSAE